MLRNVLTPLAMSNSSFNQPPSANKNNMATGYTANGKEVKGKYHVYPEKAAAGLWTNPTDLSKYIIETQLSLLGTSNKIVSKEMATKRLENNYGVFLSDFKGTKYFSHSGGNEGFVCYYVGSLQDGNGIVVMTNGRNSGLLIEIVNSIANLNNWKNYPLEPQKESISLTIQKECEKDIDKGIKLYKKLKKNKFSEYDFSNENELNNMGYAFLGDAKIEPAIKIFSLNATEFPNSANVYDSCGEAYFNNKDYEQSKLNYQKSLALNPSNTNAVEMLKKIEELLRK